MGKPDTVRIHLPKPSASGEPPAEAESGPEPDELNPESKIDGNGTVRMKIPRGDSIESGDSTAGIATSTESDEPRVPTSAGVRSDTEEMPMPVHQELVPGLRRRSHSPPKPKRETHDVVEVEEPERPSWIPWLYAGIALMVIAAGGVAALLILSKSKMPTAATPTGPRIKRLPPEIASVHLTDLKTGKKVRSLIPNDKLLLKEDSQYTIQVTTEPQAIGCVVFQLGANTPVIARERPYRITPPGQAWTPLMGRYQLVITPYRDDKAKIAGKSRTFTIEIDEMRGLTGTYFSSTKLTGYSKSRLDKGVDFDWGLEEPIRGIQRNRFSVKWTGYIYIPADGSYDFSVRSDDGIRLWVNRKLIINKWKSQPVSEFSKEITLKGDRFYPIRLDSFDKEDEATVSLMWSGPGIEKTVIPVLYLFPRVPKRKPRFE